MVESRNMDKDLVAAARMSDAELGREITHLTDERDRIVAKYNRRIQVLEKELRTRYQRKAGVEQLEIFPL